MKRYNKPSCVAHTNINGIVPLAALATTAVVESLGAVGAAALAGAAAGLAMSEAGGRDYMPLNCRTLKEQIMA